MGRKKKRAMVPASPPRFTEGSPVRVKPGIPDPDYPDIPLGGWTGVVVDIDTDSRPPLYEVEWSPATRARIHPIYERRCERDGLDSGSTWLRETDLENDPGDIPVPEQPTQLRPRPLDMNNPVEIVLGVFGLTSDDDPPPLNEETLRRFHEYLSTRLRCPMPALHLEHNLVGGQAVMLVALRGLRPIEEATLEQGLLADVTADGLPMTLPLGSLFLPPDERAHEDLLAYQGWFKEAADNLPPLPTMSPGTIALVILLLGILIGMVTGAVLEILPEARLALQIGATLLGILGGLVGASIEMMSRRDTGRAPGFLGGAFFGLILGSVCGAAAGGVALAYLGAIPGAIAGSVLAKIVAVVMRRKLGMIRTTLAGASFGAIGYAFYCDPGQAASGATYGALVGALGGILLVLALYAYVVTALSRSQTDGADQS